MSIQEVVRPGFKLPGNIVIGRELGKSLVPPENPPLNPIDVTLEVFEDPLSASYDGGIEEIFARITGPNTIMVGRSLNGITYDAVKYLTGEQINKDPLVGKKLHWTPDSPVK